MPKNVSRKRKNILPWIVAFLTLILIIISKTAYSAGEQDFRQGMQYYRNRQFSEAFPCFEKAARSGNTEAQSMIGVLYFQGNGVGKDDREAAKWFEKAARAGEPDAQTFMGVMNLEGRGMPKNEAEAFKWFEKAATNGETSAWNYLGTAYMKGQGTAKNTEKAIYWFTRAAPRGRLLLGFSAIAVKDVAPGVAALRRAWFPRR